MRDIAYEMLKLLAGADGSRHIRSIIGKPTIIERERTPLSSMFRKDKAPKKSIVETLTESSHVQIGQESPVKHYMDVLDELLTLKNEQVIGQINIDASIYAHMYSGRYCPTNPEASLKLYEYHVVENKIKKVYKGTTFKAIAEYLRDVFTIGFQTVSGGYSIYSNEQGLERHFLNLVSTDNCGATMSVINSFRMDFLYHNNLLVSTDVGSD